MEGREQRKHFELLQAQSSQLALKLSALDAKLVEAIRVAECSQSACLGEEQKLAHCRADNLNTRRSIARFDRSPGTWFFLPIVVGAVMLVIPFTAASDPKTNVGIFCAGLVQVLLGFAASQRCEWKTT